MAIKPTTYRFDSILAYSQLLRRTMDYSITISGDSVYIAAEKGECEVGWKVLQATD